jgi:hypothetical protein
MSVEILLNQLEKVRKTGASKWLACCPSHDDNDPSLSVTELPDGRILVYCFTGCSASAVVESVGLSLADLYPDGGIKDHMYGGTPGHRKHQIKQAEKIESAKLMLKICDSDRAKGKRLSQSDLAAEREAFLLVRGS